MSDPLSGRPGSQHPRSRLPLGAGKVGIPSKRGPCGIDDDRAVCRNLSVNLFSILLTSPQFSAVFEALKGTGVKIIPNNKLTVGRAGRHNRGAGRYDKITNTLELPEKVYASASRIQSDLVLITIAHEVFHALQYSRLYNFSGGESAEYRAKTITEAVMKMGRERFIESGLKIEKTAEEFAVWVVLQALKKDHQGFRAYYQIYRTLTPSITFQSYYEHDIESWWDANESLYQEDLEIEWVQWIYRDSTGDYTPDMDKEALKKWLKDNPDIR